MDSISKICFIPLSKLYAPPPGPHSSTLPSTPPHQKKLDLRSSMMLLLFGEGTSKPPHHPNLPGICILPSGKAVFLLTRGPQGKNKHIHLPWNPWSSEKRIQSLQYLYTFAANISTFRLFHINAHFSSKPRALSVKTTTASATMSRKSHGRESLDLQIYDAVHTNLVWSNERGSHLAGRTRAEIRHLARTLPSLWPLMWQIR